MTPLAEKLRPKTLEEWVGHEEQMKRGAVLFEAIKTDQLFSFILYAPPGSGKTSLCRLLKTYSKKNRWISINAVSSGVKEIREIIEGSVRWKQLQGQGTILFIDEVHRFNKGQQDALLGAVESGDIILVGATTENPSYELNAALLSRARVFRFDALTDQEILHILTRGVEELRKEIPNLRVEENSLEMIASAVTGDARSALNILEWCAPEISEKKVKEVLAKRFLQHDKTGDLHHQVVSAFIKSMRASQTDAALYYLARLWEAGEDPLYIARRMVIFASEDVGNADIRALAVANAVRNAAEFVGRPECYYNLSQGVIFLSKCAKSREAGDLFQKAVDKVQRYGHVSPPNFLINANTKLDKELGRGSAREADESFLPTEISD